MPFILAMWVGRRAEFAALPRHEAGLRLPVAVALALVLRALPQGQPLAVPGQDGRAGMAAEG